MNIKIAPVERTMRSGGIDVECMCGKDQGERTTPDGDGRFVAEELLCPQSRSVVQCLLPSLEDLAGEGIEAAAVGRGGLGTDAGERCCEIATSQAPLTHTGVEGLSNMETTAELGWQR